MQKHHRGRVSISAKIGDEVLSTGAVAWGGGIKLNEINYGASNGTLRWSVPSALLQEVKASQPRLKFSVNAHDASGDGPGEKVGYIVLDIRDLSRGMTESWFRVHGMGGGCELQVSAKINTLLQSIEVGPGGFAALLGGGGDDGGGQGMDVAASAESTGSALKIEQEEPDAHLPRYDISVSLADFKGLAGLCSACSPADIPSTSSGAGDSPPPPDAGTKFWLCWTLFDKTFQSSTFLGADVGPEKSVDTIRVQCSPEMLYSSLAESFPLRIFVCTPGRIVAAAEVNLQGGIISEVPTTVSNWYDFFVPLGSMAHTVERASVQATVSVVLASPGRTAAAQEPDESVDEAVFTPELAPPAPSEAEWDADSRVCHFRLTVDARTVSGLKRSAHYAVNFGYTHLGTSTPVRTIPQWVTASSEANIEGGTATFECVMPRNVFASKLAQFPFVMKATSRSSLGNEELGSASVNLGDILQSAPHSYRCALTGKVFPTQASYAKHRDLLVSLRVAGKVDRSPPEVPITVWTSDTFLEMTKHMGNGRTSVEGGSVRTVIIIEDMGTVGTNLAQHVKPGFKSQGAAVYDKDDGERVDVPGSQDTGMDADMGMGMGVGSSMGMGSSGTHNPLQDGGLQLSKLERNYLEKLQADWELWRRDSEVSWREDLRNREAATRRAIEEEATAALSERAEELKKAQDETARLEMRLRAALDAVDRQKSTLQQRDDEMSMRLTQKTAELQLLQRRVRDEAKSKVEGMAARLEMQERQTTAVHRQLERAEKRAKDAEKDYETYRQHMRATPEAALREEVARVKSGLSETRAVLERERRLKTEADLEKEHFRAQMMRLATALKREREKSSSLARQELEQLRLEFLAREERYVLDGDREELKTIRQEITSLRRGVQDRDMLQAQAAAAATGAQAGGTFAAGNSVRNTALARMQKQRIELIASGLYTTDDAVVKELDRAIEVQESAQGVE
jgi:hypothetical protein